MLLFRRTIHLSGGTEISLPVIASFYRSSLDAGYHGMIQFCAAAGAFDQYTLMMLEAVMAGGL